MPPSATWRMPAPDALAPALVAGRFGIGVCATCRRNNNGCCRSTLSNRPNPSGSAEALGPHGGVIIVLAAAVRCRMPTPPMAWPWTRRTPR